MNAQGSQIVNAAYFDGLVDKIDSATSTAELQKHVNSAFGALAAHKSAALAQVSALAPYLELLTLPTANPTAIVTWLQKLVAAQIAPQVAAATTYAAQITATAAKVTALTTAVQNAEQRLKAKAEAAGQTVPPITIPTV